jgi:hypothetical protein
MYRLNGYYFVIAISSNSKILINTFSIVVIIEAISVPYFSSLSIFLNVILKPLVVFQNRNSRASKQSNNFGKQMYDSVNNLTGLLLNMTT